jgi:hypothetical protein
MKTMIFAPTSVFRLNSLLHRLQKIGGPEDEPSCLDQIMIFLDDHPPGVTDRWKEGAGRCAAWGVTCSGTSVWRLSRSHALEWRVRLALKADCAQDESLEAIHERAERLLTLRACELLANPDTPAAVIVGVARLGQRRKFLELAGQGPLGPIRPRAMERCPQRQAPRPASALVPGGFF